MGNEMRMRCRFNISGAPAPYLDEGTLQLGTLDVMGMVFAGDAATHVNYHIESESGGVYLRTPRQFEVLDEPNLFSSLEGRKPAVNVEPW